MTPHDVLTFSVAPEKEGQRLDCYVSIELDECSRSYAALLIRQGHIQVDGLTVKASHKIRASELISISLPPPETVDLIPEPIPLDILHEDRHLIVLNKPCGLVVHPAAGHLSGTLVNGILHHCPDLEGIGGEKRPGIVHRLDKDTSGTMVVAKTAAAIKDLSRQFKERIVEKQYLVLVHGIPSNDSGTIDLPIGRHPVDRKKMSIVSPRAREALTIWRIKERFSGSALLEVDLKTGRTHQIRVHCKSMGHPIIGDTVYGIGKKRKKSHALSKVQQMARRQMLHAFRLSFVHPETGGNLTFESPVPDDMHSVLMALKADF